MVTIVKTLTSALLSIISIFTSVFFGGFKTTYEPIDADNIKMNFAAISDVHMVDDYAKRTFLELGLYDFENSVVPLDALVLCGDNTNGGQRDEYDSLESAFSKYSPAKNIILAEGNHDTWTDRDNYTAAQSLFVEYNKKITGRELDKAYYSTEINGYTFIVLASEIDWTFAYISDEQLEWLDCEMQKASEKGLPIFVITHWPFNRTHGLPKVWGKSDDQDVGGFGYQSDAIETILKKYKNVFMISGHLHNGMTTLSENKVYGYSSIENDGGFHSVNLPCYSNVTWKGRVLNGTGFQFEVYSDRVVIRGRNFAAGVWYPDYTYSIALD